MKALSQLQVRRCEESTKPRCKCRCRGQLHGIKQRGWEQQRMFIVTEDDVHRRKEQAA